MKTIRIYVKQCTGKFVALTLISKMNINKFLNQIIREKETKREHKGRNYINRIRWLESFPGGSVGIESACNAEDAGLIPGSRRSPGEGNDNPLQYSCLGNPMDREAWPATVHGVARVGHDLVTKPPGE